jgi:CubicO group peptidase (beta-lactamase class C family)
MNLDRLVHDINDVCDAELVPGAALASLQSGRVASVWYFGRRTIKSDAHAVTPETLFRIGSISKTVTAVAVLAEAERAHLDLDRPLATAELGVSSARSNDATGCSLRHLLSHRAGLPNAVALRELERTSTEAWLSAVGTVARPGEHFSYSNIGYALLGAWLRCRLGCNWWRSGVLAPFGFTVSPSATDSVASGHVLNPASNRLRALCLEPRDQRFVAAGFLWARITNLARFAAELAVPSTATMRTVVNCMATPQSEVFVAPSLRYGLGLFLRNDGDQRLLFHDGEIGGFQAVLQVSPDDGSGQCLMMNASAPGVDARGIIAGGRVTGSNVRSGDAPVLPDEPRQETLYVAPQLGYLRVSAAEGGLVVRSGRRHAQLRAVAPGQYFGRLAERPLGLLMQGDSPAVPWLHCNGVFCRATRLRPTRHAQFATEWEGTYENAYYLVVRCRPGVITVSSDLWGSTLDCEALSFRSLACAQGIMVFGRGPQGRILRLLGVSRFREVLASPPPAG